MTDTTDMSPCSICDKLTPPDDLCGDLACRECHVSLSFEECVDGSWANAQRAAAGLKPMGSY